MPELTPSDILTHARRPAEDADRLLTEALLRLEASDLVLIHALDGGQVDELRDAGEHALRMHGAARLLLAGVRSCPQ